MSHTYSRRVVLATPLAAAAALAVPALSCQQAGPAYPTKSLTMIIPLAAGSAPDSTFRLLAQEAEKDLGQKIVIQNRAGPGGTTGVAETIQAKPDGYTIGMCAVAMITVQQHLQDVPYKSPDDTTPIVQSNVAPTVLYINSKARWNTLKEFLDEAKQKPGQINLAVSGGPYNILHIQMALLEKLAGVKFNLIPYDSAQHLPAVLGGTVDAGVGQVALLTQHVKAGNARGLVVFGPRRAPGIPDVALAPEQGYDIKDIPYEFVMGPKGLPRNVVDKLTEVFKKAAQSPAFLEYTEKSGAFAEYVGPEELAKKLKNDAERYKKLVDDLGWAKK